MSKVVYEGWMVRYGRRKIGRSYIHMRYFVLEHRLLAYYKKKPQDNVVPLKTLLIDGNCRVEDRGLKTHHGHMVYVLSIYNKKEKNNRLTMAAFNIQEALIWKEKIEYVIDQHQESQAASGNKYHSFEYKSGMDNGRKSSSSDHESQFSAAEDEYVSNPNLLRRTTIGNGLPESMLDWTKEIDADLANQNTQIQAFSRKHWRLLQCLNGLRIFEELIEVDFLPRSCSRAMKAVGVVEATCEETFELLMSMDATRFDSSGRSDMEATRTAVPSLLFFGHILLPPHQPPGEEWARIMLVVEFDTAIRSDSHECSSRYKSLEIGATLSITGFDRGCWLRDLNAFVPRQEISTKWDSTFQYGSLVDEVDGHTAVIYHRLQLDWLPVLIWPRDLCYVRYWRRNDDGSYVVLFRSRDHESCGPQPGFVRAHIESGGFNISPLRPRNGKPRTQVQHLMQIDLKGWGVNYFSYFQQHCLLQMLNSVAGLREYFSQTDERSAAPRIPVMVNMTSASVSTSKAAKLYGSSVHQRSMSLDQMTSSNKNGSMMDDYSDEEDDYQVPDQEVPSHRDLSLEDETKKASSSEEVVDDIDLSIFSGNLRRDENDKARNCWNISSGDNFKVRGKNFCKDKSKTRAGKHVMDLVAVDWFKDTKRMDNVARRQGCAAQVASEKGLFSLVVNVQVPGSTQYSMVFYFVTKKLTPGSLLQRFVDGDDEFRNSRLKLIPSVPKGSWIVRQSVGSTPCLLGKAVDCNYYRGDTYLEIDIDIGSSAVANGVLGLVFGVITSLVVDMAFLVQGNSPDELPERLIGAVRVSHIELSSAIVPNLDDQSDLSTY